MTRISVHKPTDPIPLTRLRTAEPYRDRLAADVRAGLSGPERSLPPIHLYDARGSALFEQITRLDEYYPTRAELSILDDHLDELLAAVHPDEVVEIGSGSAVKAAKLIAAMERVGAARYVPFDISETAVVDAARQLRAAHPWLEVDPYLGDFHLDLGAIPRQGRRLVAFLGSTIGNLGPNERTQLLADFAAMLGPDGGLLLGIDLVKAVDVLEAAYDDAAGVTAAFNLNVLHVINRELDGDIPVDAFEHRAVWDPTADGIEMHLVATRDVTARVGGVGLDLAMAAGEYILTEHSFKFRIETFRDELAVAGLELTEVATDTEDRFAVVLSRQADAEH
jgi:L-histidine Nalpha-methyltransferase